MDNEQSGCPCKETVTIVTTSSDITMYGRTIHEETIRATVDSDYPIFDSEADMGA